MNVKVSSFDSLSGFIVRRVVLRAVVIASAISVVALLRVLPDSSNGGILIPVNGDECVVNLNLAFLGLFLNSGSELFSNRFLKSIWSSKECKKKVEINEEAVKKLMSMKMLLSSHAKTLCISEKPALLVLAFRRFGIRNARGFHLQSYDKLIRFEDKSFEFVYVNSLDEVSIPALLVLEMERVLVPGGVGAILLESSGLYSNTLIRSATPIASLLNMSEMVHVGYINGCALIAFKKRPEIVVWFEKNLLPDNCRSVVNNRPNMEYIEPLLDVKPIGFEKKIAYLPKFADLALKKKLVYIETFTDAHLNSESATLFLQNYPVESEACRVYFVNLTGSIVMNNLNRRGDLFVNHPGLGGNKVASKIQASCLFGWLKDTVRNADFVVAKVKASEVELKFVSELVKRGMICFVDEMFVECEEQFDCFNIVKGLRNIGVFVHQWWEN